MIMKRFESLLAIMQDADDNDMKKGCCCRNVFSHSISEGFMFYFDNAVKSGACIMKLFYFIDIQSHKV